MGNKNKYLMSIDMGTQNVKAIVFDTFGKEIVKESVNVANACYSVKSGWVEAPAYIFWEELCKVTKAVSEKMGDDINNIVACGMTANRDNILALDENNEPLRDWITWLDQRTVPEAVDGLGKSMRGISKILGMIKPGTLSIVAENSMFNWIKYNEPEIYKKVKKYVTLTGHITYLLTGQFNDMVGMQVGYLPFEVKNFNYFEQQFVYDLLGVRRDQLADKLIQSTELLGRVTEKASKQTGLPVGLPIISAGGDKQCETAGAGCFSNDSAVISCGTMASVSTNTDQYKANKKMLFYTWPSTVKDTWEVEFFLERGFWLVTWFAKRFAGDEDLDKFINRMNIRATEIAPGSNGIFVFPFWSPHSILYPEARGLIQGVSDRHRREHFYRAILEGIGYALKNGLQLIERRMLKKVKRLQIVGGGSNSDLIMQILSDVFNLPAARFVQKETGSVGAMMAAGIYAKQFKNFEEAFKLTMSTERIFKPIKDNVKVYNDIYKNVYLSTYKQHKKTFKRLSKYYQMDF